MEGGKVERWKGGRFPREPGGAEGLGEWAGCWIAQDREAGATNVNCSLVNCLLTLAILKNNGIKNNINAPVQAHAIVGLIAVDGVFQPPVFDADFMFRDGLAKQ